MRMYQGAQNGRLLSSWVSDGSSADAEIKGSISRLRNRARQLVRDNSYAAQACRVIRHNIVGTGVRLQAQVMQQRGNRLNHRINDQIEREWRKWCRKDSADVAGRLCFADIERLVVNSLCVDGEVFIQLVRKPFGRSRVPFSLRVLEADMVDEDYQGKGANPRQEWRMGVLLDEFERPLKYAFHREHPGNAGFGVHRPGKDHMILDAADVIHVYGPTTRPGMTRGVSWFAPVVKTMHHLDGYCEAELVRQRAGSAIMAWIQSPEGELFGDGVYEDQRVMPLQPGSVQYLAPGESVEVPQMGASDSGFQPFVNAMLRNMASGLGVSFENLSQDWSMSNYSSSRLSLMNERDNWKVLQYFLQENFYQPVFDAWLEMAQLAELLELPTYATEPERYQNVRWMCRGWQFVDPQKEVAAYKEAVSCGFKTQADVIAEQGGDIEDLYKARAYEMELAEEYGLKFATDAEVAAPTVDEDPQQLEAPDEPEESDGGDPEENGTEGD